MKSKKAKRTKIYRMTVCEEKSTIIQLLPYLNCSHAKGLLQGITSDINNFSKLRFTPQRPLTPTPDIANK